MALNLQIGMIKVPKNDNFINPQIIELYDKGQESKSRISKDILGKEQRGIKSKEQRNICKEQRENFKSIKREVGDRCKLSGKKQFKSKKMERAEQRKKQAEQTRLLERISQERLCKRKAEDKHKLQNNHNGFIIRKIWGVCDLSDKEGITNTPFKICERFNFQGFKIIVSKTSSRRTQEIIC